MRNVILQLVALMVVLSACQKEVSQEDPNATPGTPGSGGGGGGTKLVRTGTRLGTDSITIDYSYNAAKFLTGISYNGTLQGESFVIQQKINRNAVNVITSVVVKSPILLLLGYNRDTLALEPVYDAASGRYIRSTSRFVLDDESYIDSTVYAYNGVGKLSSQTVYFSDGMSGFFPGLKTEYAFSENNLAETKYYESGSTDFELEQITTFTHDNKVNPLPLPSEAPFLVLSNLYLLPYSDLIYLGLNDFFSVNNVANIKVNSISTSDTEETNTTYTYNSKNLPETATRTIGGQPFALTKYYYQ